MSGHGHRDAVNHYYFKKIQKIIRSSYTQIKHINGKSRKRSLFWYISHNNTSLSLNTIAGWKCVKIEVNPAGDQHTVRSCRYLHQGFDDENLFPHSPSFRQTRFGDLFVFWHIRGHCLRKGWHPLPSIPSRVFGQKPKSSGCIPHCLHQTSLSALFGWRARCAKLPCQGTETIQKTHALH